MEEGEEECQFFLLLQRGNPTARWTSMDGPSLGRASGQGQTSFHSSCSANLKPIHTKAWVEAEIIHFSFLVYTASKQVNL